MKSISGQEHERLSDLYALDVLDTPIEQEYNDLVALASQIAGMPISLITLIDLNRQWIKARVGIEVEETSRDIAFCDHAIRSDEPCIVHDTLADPRFSGNPFVTHDPNLRFYAGFPLITSKGNRVGSLCVLDRNPGSLDEKQIRSLTTLAKQVIKLFELRQKNEQLLHLSRRLEQQKQMLDSLLANQRKIISILAHDTRGPLVSMLQLLELQDLDDAEGNRQLIQQIGAQLGVTSELINNLISWGVGHLQSEDDGHYDMNEVISEAIRPYILRAKEKDTAITIKATPGVVLPLPREVACFIIRNLVHNAIKYTEKGRIEIAVQSKKDKVIAIISDTGIGIPPAIRNELFQRRVGSRSGTQKEQGSGIGLLLIRDFVEGAGGVITVQTESGKGTRIQIDFLKKAKLYGE